ncbi:MAG: hypothetical protein A4E53_04453 [Pelotomaculum sp. PtaB.Bin104]|nr:MAG: hypothetical protein A4E53_04453 [Pelotomaculum sp. PtaB.Bin104]
MSQSVIILTAVALLGIIGKNGSVAIAAGVLLIFRLLVGERPVPHLEEYTLRVGITVLTLAVLVPFATGEVGVQSLINTFRSYPGFVSILVGIMIAYLGGKGVAFLTSEPQIMVGLLIGTIVGVAFFKGVPVGPLIGAGIVAIVLTRGS